MAHIPTLSVRHYTGQHRPNTHKHTHVPPVARPPTQSVWNLVTRGHRADEDGICVRTRWNWSPKRTAVRGACSTSESRPQWNSSSFSCRKWTEWGMLHSFISVQACLTHFFSSKVNIIIYHKAAVFWIHSCAREWDFRSSKEIFTDLSLLIISGMPCPYCSLVMLINWKGESKTLGGGCIHPVDSLYFFIGPKGLSFTVKRFIE